VSWWKGGKEVGVAKDAGESIPGRVGLPRVGASGRGVEVGMEGGKEVIAFAGNKREVGRDLREVALRWTGRRTGSGGSVAERGETAQGDQAAVR
jgi:hypothetical protein